jgi:hypothetical protein
VFANSVPTLLCILLKLLAACICSVAVQHHVVISLCHSLLVLNIFVSVHTPLNMLPQDILDCNATAGGSGSGNMTAVSGNCDAGTGATNGVDVIDKVSTIQHAYYQQATILLSQSVLHKLAVESYMFPEVYFALAVLTAHISFPHKIVLLPSH